MTEILLTATLRLNSVNKGDGRCIVRVTLHIDPDKHVFGP